MVRLLSGELALASSTEDARFQNKEMKEMDPNSNPATEILPQKFNQKDLESVRMTAITTSGSYTVPLS
jgi:hypothetical protein